MSEDKKKTTNANPAPAANADCYGGGDDVPKGFEEGGTPEVDGWWNAEAGLVFTGQVVGHFTIEDKQKTRDVVTVRLSKPTLAMVDKQKVRLEVGQVLGVSLSYRLLPLLDYVEHKGMVWARAESKKDIGRGQSMWLYKLAFKGQKGAPPAQRSAASDDALPF